MKHNLPFSKLHYSRCNTSPGQREAPVWPPGSRAGRASPRRRPPAQRSGRTFVGGLWVGGQRDVVQLAQAEPFSIHRHPEFAKIDGLHGSLSDLVCGGGWHVALRRQSRHDDSAGTTTTRGERTKKKSFLKNKIRNTLLLKDRYAQDRRLLWPFHI